jgi:hypothetical protein
MYEFEIKVIYSILPIYSFMTAKKIVNMDISILENCCQTRELG